MSTQSNLWGTVLAASVCSALIGYVRRPPLATSRVLELTLVLPPRGSSNSAPQRGAGSVGEESESEDEDSDDDDATDLVNVKAEGDEPCKLVLVVRTDLQMTKGKIAAQCGHATLACYKTLLRSNAPLIKHWERTGQAKIAVKCDSEDELLLLQATAKSLGICARAIQDAGRTQVAAGSTTVLGIGPAPVRVVNQVTSHLKLL
ncbi:mitochondrial peptidyl-trna hydrolase [Pseudohyphozyma bogoriensis]|nr:mitochondrial peptidyl-trna hydrolase [Pseudohyphozyma bogoriensis]